MRANGCGWQNRAYFCLRTHDPAKGRDASQPSDGGSCAHFPGHFRASLRKLSLSCLMASRSPKYYYLVIHDTHKLLLWGSEVVWDLGLIHSKLGKSVSSQFVCLRVWISTVTASFYSASNKRKHILLHVLLEELLEGICIHVRQESLMHWTCNCHFFSYGALETWLHKHACVSTDSHKDTHVNLSLFNGGLHVQRINSVSCSTALRCRSRKAFAAPSIIHTRTLSHAHACTIPLHTITQLTYCSLTNTMHFLPRSCSSLPHNQAHASS